MNGYERTVNFVNNNEVDRPPFMPLAIEWISRQENVDYKEFVYDPIKRAKAYIDGTRRFNIDCVLPDADFYEQLEDFGAKPELADTGYHAGPIISSPKDVNKLPVPTFQPGTRMGNRLITLNEVAKEVKGEKYIFGICVGPFTEYCNARVVENALCDLFDNIDETLQGIKFFYENCMKFIELQLEAGADGIQIVEPTCSLISPSMYEEYILPMHKKLVAKIQQNGGIARLHICGDTNRLLPFSIASKAKVIDVDKEVDMENAAKLLNEGQYLCGNISPATELLNGKPEIFEKRVKEINEKTNGKTIISAGCDVPPTTSRENMIAFYRACQSLAE